MNSKQCRHGYYVNPVTGEHIIPNNTAIPIEEAARLHQQNKEPAVIVHKAPTEKEKEFNASVKKWDRYFEKNRGKIPPDFGKTFFDRDIEKYQKANSNTVKDKEKENEVAKLKALMNLDSY